MSELLRAVLDQSCSFSQPAWYTINFTSLTAAPTEETESIVLHQDRYFLMTSMALIYENSNQSLYALSARATLFDPLTSERLFCTVPATVTPPNQLSSQLINGNLNNLFTLPEYKLWRPASRIGATVSVDSANPITPANFAMVLCGVEYGV